MAVATEDKQNASKLTHLRVCANLLICLLTTIGVLLAPLAPARGGPIRDRMYRPDTNWSDPGPWTGAAPEAIRFETEDGLTLGSWFWPGRRDRLLIFFHGNAGNQTYTAHYLEPLVVPGGPSVMVGSYRGYGGNPGAPGQKGLMADARAALAEAAARGFAPDQIVVIGWSLGGAVALGLAAEAPLAGVVTIGTFTRMTDMAPAIARPFMGADRWDSLAALGKVEEPVIFFHGDRDEVVPYRMGQQLFDAAPGPKRFVTAEGGGHRIPMGALAPFLLRSADAIFERRLDLIDFADSPAKTP